MENDIIGSTQLNDSISGELSYFVVRVANESIGVGLSQESNGDAEIFMDIKNCEYLIKLLSIALSKAKLNNK